MPMKLSKNNNKCSKVPGLKCSIFAGTFLAIPWTPHSHTVYVSENWVKPWCSQSANSQGLGEFYFTCIVRTRAFYTHIVRLKLLVLTFPFFLHNSNPALEGKHKSSFKFFKDVKSKTFSSQEFTGHNTKRKIRSILYLMPKRRRIRGQTSMAEVPQRHRVRSGMISYLGLEIGVS